MGVKVEVRLAPWTRAAEAMSGYLLHLVLAEWVNGSCALGSMASGFGCSSDARRTEETTLGGEGKH